MNSLAARWFQISLAKRAVIVMGPIACAFGLICADVIIGSWPKREFARSYDALKLRQTKAQVEDLFDRPADYRCTFADSEIWYFSSRARYAQSLDDLKLPPNARFQELSKLPDVYDHAQLAFDRHGELHAYTWIGETINLTSKRGLVPGSHLKVLPPDAF